MRIAVSNPFFAPSIKASKTIYLFIDPAQHNQQEHQQHQPVAQDTPEKVCTPLAFSVVIYHTSRATTSGNAQLSRLMITGCSRFIFCRNDTMNMATMVPTNVTIIQGRKHIGRVAGMLRSPDGNNAHRNNIKTRRMQTQEHDLRIARYFFIGVKLLQALHGLQAEWGGRIVEPQ